ncbi:Serine/threonine-protein kinase, active site [Sesbania bispinosa]|nr:Serine/threonine-protein kinase, active site [Sesbania bispinosa]
MASLSLLILTTLLFLQLLLVFANINLNSTLSTNDNLAWLSPSGEFAYGFRQLKNSTSLFTLAIWYNKIPLKTIVWNAEAEAPKGSQVQLTSQGLMLTSPEAESLWMAKPDATFSYGAMLDTGNFVLVNEQSQSVFVWESFKNPTDTLLPDQSLELDVKLTSRFTETNYTTGRFQLYFEEDNNVLLSPLAWPSQFRYGSYYKIDASGSASRLVFHKSGDIYVETTNGTKVQPQGAKWEYITLNPKVYYYRATLDFHGVFTQYAYPKDSTSEQEWRILSYCSMENQSQRPTCKCPDGYSLVDPSNDFGGCQLKSTLVCGADVEARPEDLYELLVARDINFPFGDYERIEPFSQEDCQQSCFQDCMCAIAHYNVDARRCWKKRIPLLNGRVDRGPDLVFIKTRVSPLRNFDNGKLDHVVAVKKLDRLAEEGRDKEFKTELSAISKTCHKNPVRLIGFCDEGIHKLLVYEFMSNGTLANILFAQPKPIWNLRVGFALGIARGLVYLHEECDTPIIHCDIKPQNVLIDDHFTAKISDFGLAKLLLLNQSRTNTMIRGTKGYVAPEWFKNVPVTVKVDVYSFGVMLLEIICCRRNELLMESHEEKAILSDWAYDCYMEGRIDALLDDDDKEARADHDRLQRWVKIAIWGIQEHHEIRPTMGMVMQMLQGFVQVPDPPSPSSFN